MWGRSLCCLQDLQRSSPLAFYRKCKERFQASCNLQESKRQADFDEALRDARALRMDLGHDQRRCEAKLTSLIAQQCELEARGQRLVEKQKGLPRHLKQRTAETEHDVREVSVFQATSHRSIFCWRMSAAFLAPSKSFVVSIILIFIINSSCQERQTSA